LTPEQIERHMYRSLPPGEGRYKFNVNKAHQLRLVPGFVPEYRKRDTVHFTRYSCPGLVIPVMDELGRVRALRVRPDKPGTGGKYRWFVLDDGPAIPRKTHFAFPPGRRRGCFRVAYVVEGEIKGNILADACNVPVIVVPGIDCQQEIEDSVRRLAGHRVEILVIAADSDARAKHQVASGACRLFDTLRTAFPRLTIGVARWPQADGNGIDEVIQAGKNWEVELPGTPADLARMYGWEWSPDCRTAVTKTMRENVNEIEHPGSNGRLGTADAFELTAKGTPQAVNSKNQQTHAQHGPGSEAHADLKASPSLTANPSPPVGSKDPPEVPLDERTLPYVRCPCRKRLLQYTGAVAELQGFFAALFLYCGRWRCVCQARLRVLWARAIRRHVRGHVNEGGKLYLGNTNGDEPAYKALTQWLRTHGVAGRYIGVQPLQDAPMTLLAAVQFNGSREVNEEEACAALFDALERVHVTREDQKRRPVRNGRAWGKTCPEDQTSGNWMDRGRVGFETPEDLENALRVAGINVRDGRMRGSDIMRAIQFQFPNWEPHVVEAAIRAIRDGRSIVEW
jgi:hypothetical protein